LAAIEAHASNGSGANAVEANFDNLTTAQKQDVLNFLMSLTLENASMFCDSLSPCHPESQRREKA
jgi:hypothetical protein